VEDGEVARGRCLVYGDRGLRVPSARKCRAAEAERLALRREVRGIVVGIRNYVSCPCIIISTSQGPPDQSNKVWAEVHTRTSDQ
jgi:hypothetical protein